jgi:phosphoglycerate dehydrogenase-like enzyme
VSNPFKVLLCRKLHPAGMALLDARPDVSCTIMHDPPVAEFHAALAQADATLCWLERVDQATLDAAPKLRCVWQRRCLGTQDVRRQERPSVTRSPGAGVSGASPRSF